MANFINIKISGNTIMTPRGSNLVGRPTPATERTMILPINDQQNNPYYVNTSIEQGSQVVINGTIFSLGGFQIPIANSQGYCTIPIGTLYSWKGSNGLLEDVQRIAQPVILQIGCPIRLLAGTLVCLGNIQMNLIGDIDAILQ